MLAHAVRDLLGRGRIHKQDVALFENYYMEGEPSSHVIETPFAKVGIGICYENTRAFLSELLVEHDADIVLQPHSCPSIPSYLPRWAVRTFETEIRDTAKRYAMGLGIPAVFVNKCGPFDTPLPMFPYRLRVPFAGSTAIADSDGTVLTQVEKEEAVLVKTVQLDAGRKTHRALPSRGLWTSRAPWYALRYLEWVDRRAKASYAKNRRRVAAARAMTRQNDPG